VNGREVLTGHRVVVDGFLSRIDNYFFLSQGKRRPVDRPGDNGEQFVCNFRGSPNKVWFSLGSVEPGDWKSRIRDDISVGRRAVVSGVFYNETSGVVPDESVHAVAGQEFSTWSIGPLRNVRIIKLLNDRCLGSGY
jgi:hypothetical protein